MKLNDRTALIIIYGTLFGYYMFFFSPKLRFDSLKYIETARSILFDGDLNTCNEEKYFTEPGWNHYQGQPIFSTKRQLISFMAIPDVSNRGYHYTFFPMGATIFWFFPMLFTKAIFGCKLEFLSGFPDNGYSTPYLLALSYWNLLWFMIGVRIAYHVLRQFFSISVSLISFIAVIGCGNILPFVFIDVGFSHALDFVLVTAFLAAHGHYRLRPDPSRAFFWGALAGFAVIVRYQDIFLLILPVIEFLFELKTASSSRQRWMLSRNMGCFLLGFFLCCGIQLLYWQLLHGEIFPATSAMGTSGIPSFNVWQPELMAMFFSRFHGLFSWMPLLLPTFIGLLLFPIMHRRLGFIYIFIFMAQIYYNSTRTEWWNLGFGVRRFSGYLIFFMIGFGTILSLIHSKKIRATLCIVLVPLLLWNLLFMGAYYQEQQSGGTIISRLTGNGSPYQPPDYGIVVPSQDMIKDIMGSCVEYFRNTSWMGRLLSEIAARHPWPEISRFLVMIVLFVFVSLLSGAFPRIYRWMNPGPGMIVLLIIGLSLGWYTGLAALDLNTQVIRVCQMKNRKFTGETLPVRLNRHAPYLGVNETVRCDPEACIRLTRPVLVKTVHVLWRSLSKPEPQPAPVMMNLKSEEGTTVQLTLDTDMLQNEKSVLVNQNLGNERFEGRLIYYRTPNPEGVRSLIQEIHFIASPDMTGEIAAVWFSD